MKRNNKKRKQPIKKKKKLHKIIIFSSVAVLFSFLTYKGIIFLGSIFYDVTKNLGFVINDIYLTENGTIPEENAEKYIKISRGDAILAYSANQIASDIMKNPWIKEATVHKGFPDKVSISVTYKQGIAVFQQDSKFTIIDKNGDNIIEITRAEINPDLPTIVGEGGKKQAFSFLQILNNYPTIRKKLNSIAYIRERRWNIIVAGGIAVKLPEKDMNAALNLLEIMLKNPDINRKTVKIIDMRIKDKVVLSGSKMANEADNKKI